MSLFLLRHGETDGNLHRVVQHPELPLNERGMEQAARLGERLREAGLSRVLSSDYARARMTAEAVAAAAGIGIEVEPLLRERHFGDLRGLSYASFDFDPMAPGYVPPNGESWSDFHQRAERAWRRVESVVAETRGAVAVVTHGLICHSFALHHLELPPPLTVPERWGNTSLTEIEAPAPWRVRVLNSVAHLEGAAEESGAASGY